MKLIASLPILFIGALFILGTNISFSQSPKTIEVGKQGFSNRIRSSAFDNSGNIYHSGFFKGALTINNDTLLYGNGNNDFFVVKLDSTGQPVWGLNMGSDQDDQSDISILYQHEYIYVGFTVRYPFSIGNTLITDIIPGENTSILLKLDTTGNVIWAKKTNAVINKILHGKGKIIMECTRNIVDPPTYFEDSIIFEPNGFNNRLYISIHEDGNFIQCKSIYQNTSGSVSNICLSDTIRNRLYFLIITSANPVLPNNNRLFIGNSSLLLPNLPGTYILLKTDTSLNLTSSKVLNPNGGGFFIGTFYPGRFRLSADSMHLNLLVNAGSYTLDGLNVNLNDANSLLVFDTSLVTHSIKKINHNPVFETTRRLNIQLVEEDIDSYYIIGTVVANNQSNTIAEIPVRNIEFPLTESFSQTVNINGPSQSYLLKTDKQFNKLAFSWLGQTSVYEMPTISVDNIQINKNHLHFLTDQDNTWNPWKISKDLTLKYGGFKPNADGADYAEQVGFFSNKSSYIVGTTSGLNAFDTSNNGIISTNTRRDCFFAILNQNGTLKKYHRIFSSFSTSAPMRVRMHQDTLYVFIAFISNRNQAGFNYIKVDTITRLVSGNIHRALFKIAPNGNIQHLDFQNTLIGAITDFDVYENGDLAALSFNSTLAPNLNGQQFPSVNGFFVGRMQPNGIIKQAIKIGSPSILSILNPLKIQLESNEEIAGLLIQTSFRNNLPEIQMVHYRNGNQQSTKLIPNPLPEEMAQKTYILAYRLSSTENLDAGLAGPVGLSSFSGFTSLGKKNILFINNVNAETFKYNNQVISTPISTQNSFLFNLDSNLQYLKHWEFKPVSSVPQSEFRIMSVKIIENQLFISGLQSDTLKFGSLKIPHNGNGDGLTLKTDTAFNILQFFKVSSPYSEITGDFDIYTDSTFMVGFRSQTNPAITIGLNSINTLNNNSPSVNPSDFDEKGYVTLSPGINMPNDYIFTIKKGNWHDPAIWNAGKVPASNDRVIIKHEVQVTQAATCFTIYMDPTAKLLVTPSIILQITGTTGD